jgi:hypothetical protein
MWFFSLCVGYYSLLAIREAPLYDKLFNNPQAYNAILAFLDATDIGLRVNNNKEEEEEAYNQDS